MLTPRENLLRIFRHELPEWIPVVGHVDPYNQPNREGMDPALAQKLGTVQWCGEATIDFSRYLGLDIMDYLGPPLRFKRQKVSVESEQDGADTLVTWHTPKGDLREIIRRCREDGTSYRVEHLVKGPQDLEAFTAAFEDEDVELDAEAAASIRRRKELIGDDGMLMLFMNGTPLGMMYRVYTRLDTLAYLWADAPKALADLFRAMTRSYLKQFHIAAQSAADALVGMDDTSTTTISPKMFEQYDMDYTDQVAAVTHDAGKLYFHHSCGLIKELLAMYRRTAMDAVHGYTIPPIGDVTVGEGRKRLGDRVTIIAGLIQLFGNMDDRAAVSRSVAAMFDQGQPGDHLILGLAADPEKTMEQTRFIADECRKHQRSVGG